MGAGSHKGHRQGQTSEPQQVTGLSRASSPNPVISSGIFRCAPRGVYTAPEPASSAYCIGGGASLWQRLRQPLPASLCLAGRPHLDR